LAGSATTDFSNSKDFSRGQRVPPGTFLCHFRDNCFHLFSVFS